jgi:hypothetical protein
MPAFSPTLYFFSGFGIISRTGAALGTPMSAHSADRPISMICTIYPSRVRPSNASLQLFWRMKIPTSKPSWDDDSLSGAGRHRQSRRTKISAVEGRREASPVDPPGVLGRSLRMSAPSWNYRREGRWGVVRSALPSLWASWESPQAQAMEYVIVAEYGSGMVGTCSLTLSKFRRDDSHSLCTITMMIRHVAASFDYAFDITPVNWSTAIRQLP